MKDLDTIFLTARELPAEQWPDYLEQACEDDAELRARVERMLWKTDEARAFFEESDHESPTAGPGPTIRMEAEDDEGAGTVIGRYKLLQKIGEGGFGTVWMAEQKEPISRKVALKVIKMGMDTRQVIARFEAERQALAMMDDEHIAKVFDAGATDRGRPYFVMELVKGVPITKYCDEAGLGPRERLALFGDVCSALQHAHQKGIIHRDIKPNNVMVTLRGDQPVVKVIDFGIAKATQGKLTDNTLFTQFEQVIGTPAYMSPEQAGVSGQDIDTRSDIYSLGVLLYELLTGKPPFDARTLMSAGYDEMRRIIREEEPPKPSIRLSTVAGEERAALARLRKVDPAMLSRLVASDLDWIVMKAIDKDRTRRYETANAFAQDIVRFLADEPVTATPPSAGYKFRKFARRHKAAFGIAAAMVILLLAGIAATTWQAVRATTEKERANAERNRANEAKEDAEATSSFLTGMFVRSQPGEEQGGIDVKVVDILKDAVAQLEEDQIMSPERRARLQATLGKTYSSLGLSPQAIPLQEKARGYFLATKGPEHLDTRRATQNLAVSYRDAGRRDEALEMREKLLALSRKVKGPEHPSTLSVMIDLATSYDDAGRKDEALKMGEELLALSRKVLGAEHPDTLGAMNNLAISHADAGRRDEALEMREAVLVLYRKVKGEEHPDTLSTMSNLAISYAVAGRLEEALKMGEELLALRRKVLGPEHPETLKAMTNLANSYDDDGRRDEALKIREEALALSREVLGDEHPDTLTAMNNLATSYRDVDRRDEALKMWEEFVPLSRKVNGPEHSDTLKAVHNLALLYDAAGRQAEAVKMGEELLALSRKVLGDEHPSTLGVMHNLANSYFAAGRRDEAIKLREELLALRRKVNGPEHPDTLQAMINLGTYYRDTDRLDEALKMWDEVVPLSRKVNGPEHPETLGTMTDLASSYFSAGRLPEAIELQERSLALKRRVLPKTHPYFAAALGNMARFYAAADRLDEAKKLREELAALRPPANASAPPVALVLITPTSEWKWLHPTDGVDPQAGDPDFHTTFFAPDYDDSGWKTGTDSAHPNGGFGYGRDFSGQDIGTPLNPDHRHSAYFRHRFTTEKPHAHLELRCQRDDALIVYLDGKEVVRDNLPAGPDSYRLSATQPQGPENDGVIHRFPIAGTLNPGVHTLAISVHNPEGPSSDLRIGGITLVEVESMEDGE